MLPVLDLDPVWRPSAAIDAVPALGHQPLQPHQTGMPEQIRPDLTLLEIAQEDSVNAPRQQPRQVGLPHRDNERAVAITQRRLCDQRVPARPVVTVAGKQAHPARRNAGFERIFKHDG